jgi:hypothetical protein
MGHTGGLEVLHRHYYRCVRQADAQAFWAIQPEATSTEPSNFRSDALGAEGGIIVTNRS